MPESLSFHRFLVRVGEFGGYVVVQIDDPAALHTAASAFAVFQFR